MMTKYQLVYSRLEASLRRICRNLEARRRLRLKQGFRAFARKRTQALKPELVRLKFATSLALLFKACERYQTRVVTTHAFRVLREHSMH
jgi:hypothetical protein